MGGGSLDDGYGWLGGADVFLDWLGRAQAQPRPPAVDRVPDHPVPLPEGPEPPRAVPPHPLAEHPDELRGRDPGQAPAVEEIVDRVVIVGVSA